MCGRMQHENRPSWRQIHEYYGTFVPESLPEPKGDVSPADPVPIVAKRYGERRMTGARWGFVPRYVKHLDELKGYHMFNARDDKIKKDYDHWASMPVTMQHIRGSAYLAPFLDGFKCLLPMNAYYEFKDGRPYRFTLENRPLFSVAGLWEWNPILRMLSCTMITTEPNRVAGLIHDRMPVILNPHQYEQWLSVDTPPGEAIKILKPYEDSDLRVEGLKIASDNQMKLM